MNTDSRFRSWLKEADKAGRKAAASTKRGKNEPCVIIWLKVFASSGAFYRWAKKNQALQPHRECGSTSVLLEIDTKLRGSKKLAYATAYADVLQKHGVSAYEGSRLD